MPYYEPTIIERREPGSMALLRLHAPELARAARPGQIAMARCAPAGSEDPPLRRPLFLAGADGAAGVVDLLAAPDERGLAWLAAQPVGAQVDLYGPVGAGFTLDGRTRNLLLAGVWPALPALFFLARTAVARGMAVVLLAAGEAGRLPPPFLLPPEVEYQSGEELLALLARPQLGWADQVCLGLDETLVAGAAAAVRAARLRWERGFAHVALAGPTPCGLGTCQACPVEARDGARLRCKDGPVFDLRELR